MYITDIQVKSNFQALRTHCRISGKSVVQSPRRLKGWSAAAVQPYSNTKTLVMQLLFFILSI